MPVTAPQVQLQPRHLSSTTLTASLSNVATTMTVASGTIFDALPTAALLTDGVNVEIISVDSVASGTTYNITRATEPATSASAFPANTTTVKLIIAAETMRRLQRGFRERTTGMVNVREYGAVGDGKAWLGASAASHTMLSGSATLNLATSAFVPADVGKTVVVYGAGSAGRPLVTTIAAYVSGTQATLSATASTTANDQVVVWGTDDTAAIQAAINSLPTNGGGRVTLPAGLYLLTSTLTAVNYLELYGQPSAYGPARTGDPTANHGGTTLVWAGATSTPMVKLFNNSGVIVHGLTADGSGIAGVTGFLIDSNNAPNCSLNVIEDFCCFSCEIGVALGTSGGAGDYQSDGNTLRRFWIRNDYYASTATGIKFNSANTQWTQIEQGVIQNANKGIYFRRFGGFTTVDRVVFGAVQYGSLPTALHFTYIGAEVVLKNCQSEGAACYFLRADDQIDDIGTPTNGLFPITLIGCHLDNDILVTGGQSIVSIGCTASASGHSYILNNVLSNLVQIADVLPDAWVITAGARYQLGNLIGATSQGHTVPQLKIDNTQGAGAGGTPTPLLKHLVASGTQALGTINANTTAIYDISGVTGARAGDTATLTAFADLPTGLLMGGCTVISDNTVRLRVGNVTTGNIAGGNLSYRLTVLGTS